MVAIRSARKAAAGALKTLQAEIALLRSRLDELIGEQKAFLADLFPSGAAPRMGLPSRRTGRVVKGTPRRRGPAKADRFFAKLPNRFTIEQVRKIAGRLSGVSLAQWSRAKRIAKTAAGYVKIGAAPAKKSGRKQAAKTTVKRRRRVAKKVKRQQRPQPTAAATTS
jgi:hypothetical protein